jgi:hypothetical protein
MVFGLSTLGFVHTALCLIALVSGLALVGALVAGRRLAESWAAAYFATAVAADATGFALSRGFGIVEWLGSAIAITLLVAILARYWFGLKGRWRLVFAVATVASVYGLVFFTIGEAFIRIPALRPLAPTLTELPFVIAQLAALVAFVGLAIAAALNFRDEAKPQRSL